MTILLPDSGEQIAVGVLVNKLVPQDLRLRLFQSNTTPAETDTAATYTESSFTGYAGINLTGANWTLTAGNPTSADYAQQTFSSSANQTVQQCYGYYLTQVTSGTLVLAERFPDGPYPIANNGDQVKVTPHIEQA
jgi:hypothetical protein